MAIQPTNEQLSVCQRFSAEAMAPDPAEKLGIAISTLQKLPLTAVRHQAVNGTCGWYIWGGEYSSDPDFYQPLHASHVLRYCPQILPYLALPPGWAVVLAPDYEDVWFDENRLAE